MDFDQDFHKVLVQQLIGEVKANQYPWRLAS
jgi:hypothetical protein